MTNDWVDDGTLSRDETVKRLAALNPTPSEPDTLHRYLSRMAAELMLFTESETTTRGEIRVTADRFATEVLDRIATERWKVIEDLTEAIRLTVEYVGVDALPPIEGWSWYDALVTYAPEKAEIFKGYWIKLGHGDE